jgi:site-specific recombinase XerC
VNEAMKTITTQIQLDSSQFEVLSEESKRRKISVGELLHSLVKQYLDEIFISRKRDQADFMSIVGLGDSGNRDISENHDRYLGELIANEHIR